MRAKRLVIGSNGDEANALLSEEKLPIDAPLNKAVISNFSVQSMDYKKIETKPDTLGGHESSVFKLLVLPDGNLISTSRDLTQRIWDKKEAKCFRLFKEHKDIAYAVEIIDCDTVATADDRGEIIIWNFRSGEVLTRFVGHSGKISILKLLPAGLLASAASDNTVRIWDIQKKECRYIFSGNPSKEEQYNTVSSLAVFPEHNYLASISWDFSIQIWNYVTGKCWRTLVGHTCSVFTLEVLNDSYLASAAEDAIKIWDVTTAKCTHTLKGHTDIISELLHLSNDCLASASWDGTLRIWNYHTGECLHVLQGHKQTVTDMISLSTNELASTSDDGTVRFWNLLDGECFKIIDMGSPIYTLVKLQDNKIAVSGKNGVIQMLGAPTIVTDEKVALNRPMKKKEISCASSIVSGIISVLKNHKCKFFAGAVVAGYIILSAYRNKRGKAEANTTIEPSQRSALFLNAPVEAAIQNPNEVMAHQHMF